MIYSGKITSDRKYFLAIFFSVVSTLGLFFGKITGGEFVTLAGVILGLYGAANVATKSIVLSSEHRETSKEASKGVVISDKS